MSLTTTARLSAGRGDRGEILTQNTFNPLRRSGFAVERAGSPAQSRNPDLWGSKRFYRVSYNKTGQNAGARADRSSAVSETVDAGIWKS